MVPNITDSQNYKIVYRRWVLLVPVFVILVGVILLVYDGSAYSSLSMVGYLIILIGILTLGALLVGILAISLSARTLAKSHPIQESFREKIDADERLQVEKEDGS
ncbi:MAG: hypothetical protein ACW98F_13550 [Candidatus Hodarchaeales archaeon]|jgi:uncharacterized Tic20 family protein